jgi:hypothetical protein
VIHLITLFICLSFKLFMIFSLSVNCGDNLFSAGLFFFFHFYYHPCTQHNDTLPPENLFFLTLNSFILVENKPDSHYSTAVWYSGKDTWLKIRRAVSWIWRNPFTALILSFIICKMKKLKWMLFKTPVVLENVCSPHIRHYGNYEIWELQRCFLPQSGLGKSEFFYFNG